MYGKYVVAVLRRAFQPTARFTDVLQILAASLAPAIAKFLGFPVPTPEDTLAYIGAAALAFVALRIFFVAPYQVWLEQVGRIGELQAELAKPEHIEGLTLAKVRARKRIKLAAVLRRMYWQAGLNRTDQRVAAATEIERLVARGVSLMGEAGTGPTFGRAFATLNGYCFQYLIHQDRAAQNTAHDLIANMLEYLHGRITAEALALLLPPYIEVETQQ